MPPGVGFETGISVVGVQTTIRRGVVVADVHADRCRSINTTAIVWVVERYTIHPHPGGPQLLEHIDRRILRVLRIERQPPGVILIDRSVGISAFTGEVAHFVIRKTAAHDDKEVAINTDVHVGVKRMALHIPLGQEVSDIPAISGTTAIKIVFRSTPATEEKSKVRSVDDKVSIEIGRAEDSALLNGVLGERRRRCGQDRSDRKHHDD